MKKYILTYSLLLASFGAFAQNYTDALRYSRMQYLGTARFNAMGGSFGALGGDLSAISINPAATGLYRNSEFTFTTALSIYDMESTYNGNFGEDSRGNFNIGNIGYVGSYRGDPNGWKNFSFAIGHNRMNNFHKDIRIQGNSMDQSSIIDDYVNTLNNDMPAATEGVVADYGYDFGPSQAYYTYMLNPVYNEDTILTGYRSAVDIASEVEQDYQSEISGHQSETYFSFGGNYQDRLYLGANIGLSNLRYQQNTTYSEYYTYDPPARSDEFLSTQYKEQRDLLTTGAAFNFKLGAIYKVNESIRLGASMHSPNFYNMTEEYSYKASSEFSDGSKEEDAVISTYEYKLRTPMRYMASLAYVFKNVGLFNVEYEYVDYSTAKFDDKRRFRYDYSETNRDVRNTLKATHNLRFGAEYRLEPFVIRGGFRYEDNPFQSNLVFKPDESRKTYSLGSGYRSQNYNIDLTYMYSEWQNVTPLYESVPSEALVDNKHHQIMLTVGWKW